MVVEAYAEMPSSGISVLFPWPPSRNALHRAVSIGRGSDPRRIMMKSREYRAWLAEAEKAVQLQAATPVTGRVHVKLSLWPPTRAIYDPDNYSKAIMDALVAFKIIDGDTHLTIASLQILPQPKSERTRGVWAHIDRASNENKELDALPALQTSKPAVDQAASLPAR